MEGNLQVIISAPFRSRREIASQMTDATLGSTPSPKNSSGTPIRVP